MIQQKLAERDMPQDLLYLAMIESGFNPKAYSHAHASESAITPEVVVRMRDLREPSFSPCY
ncbi:MAG TPA: transglycosylase SLT domain-containing protein [Thermoanaerobaculia bacterium]|nr:transglycosylase SLT domain-containing protein [Thermoanaerobaculia bacterium]